MADREAVACSHGHRSRIETIRVGTAIEIWQEQDDGTVEIHCITPEHVLANTLNCLQFERYDVLRDALLAERTREEFIARGGSPA